MNRLRKAVFYILIPVVISCMIESCIYFQQIGLDFFQSFLCSLDNVIRIFVARPTLLPHTAFCSIDETYTQLDIVMVYVYSVMVVAAPILMTTAIVAGFSAYIFDFVNSIKISFKDKMYIVGDGNTAGVIAFKYSKKMFVHYLMPTGVKNEERVPLLREKVKAFCIDYAHMPDFCKSTKIEKASCVVLNFSDWFKSFRSATDVVEYLIVKHQDDDQVPVYVIDVPGVFKNVFENTYKGFCLKHGKKETVLKLSYINVDQTNAENFFENPKLTVQPDNTHHIVFIGAEGYGRSMIKELGRYMRSNRLNGTVDVFDSSVETCVNNLMYSEESLDYAGTYEAVDTAKNARCSVAVNNDGCVFRMNYYEVNMGEYKASEYLDDIIKQYKVTEIFCCLDDLSLSFECYRMIQGFGEDLKDAKAYFRIRPTLENPFDALRVQSSTFEFLPDGFQNIELIGKDMK